MPKVPLSIAHRNRSECWRLRDQGLSYRAIAAALGLKLGSVQNYLSTPPAEVSPDEFLAVCAEIKRARRHLGAIPVADKAAESLGLDAPVVSKGKVAEYFKSLDLPAVPRVMAGDSKRPFWFDDIRRAGDVWQLDTVKLTAADGTQYEFLAVVDMWSRACWAVYLPGPGYEAWALTQCFEVLGVPRVISADNGRGWPMDTGSTLSDLLVAAFQAGVQRFQFIPVSRPQYNGRVERQNRTLKHRDWMHRVRYDAKTVDDICEFVYLALREYNETFSHRSLGGTGKHNRVTPMRAHMDRELYNRERGIVDGYDVHYNARENDTPCVLTFSHSVKQMTAGTVSYIRRVSNQGHAFVGVPELTFDLGGAVGTWYARFDLTYGGVGSVTLFDPSARRGRVIGSFAHSYGVAGPVVRFCRVELLPGLVVQPRVNDDTLETYFEQAHQKRKASRPEGYVPGGSRYVANPDDLDGWMLVNKRGQVIDSSSWRHRPDHSDDIFGS